MKIILAVILIIMPQFIWAEIKPFEILNPKVSPGDTVVIKINPQWQSPRMGLQVADFIVQPNKFGYAFVGIPADTQSGAYRAMLTDNNIPRIDLESQRFEILDNNLPERKKKLFVPTKKWQKEREAIRRSFADGDFMDQHFQGWFLRPLEEIKTDNARTIGSISSPFSIGHSGVDLVTLDLKTNKHERKVIATNSSKVALIAKRFSTDGNMIILDHGSGIYSVYMHLSKMLVVKVGQSVKKGDIIGITGQTGAALKGPHLHFAIRVNGVYVDPFQFIETMNNLVK